MMRLFSRHTIPFLLILLTGALKAQDPQLSQFYAAPLYLGSSFAGITSGSRVSLNYRKQWPVIANGFNTYAFGFDHYFANIKSGVGLVTLRDNVGTGNLSLTSIGALYSYHITIDRKWNLKPGLTFWYSRHGLDFFKLLFPDQVEFSNTSTETPTMKYKAHIDFSSSLVVYNQKVWMGVTMDHMMRPNQSLAGATDRIPYKWSVYGGGKFPIRSHYRRFRAPQESITTAFLYKKQGDAQQLDLGLYWNKQPMILGLWLRGIPFAIKNPGMDALVFLAGIEFNDYTVAYSYDITVSQLGVNTGGTHEISLSYVFNNKPRIKHKKAALPCPSF
jgi:type IX secretion system PorP/SprF family membrane protein